MESVDTTPVTVRVTRAEEYQGLTIWLGDGAPCTVDDRSRPEDVADWISHPIQRAVTIARLRAVADALEAAAR